MRAAIVSSVLWIGLICVGAIVGAYSSFLTGKSTEIPKWNGWSYLWFCMKDFAILTALVTFPIAAFVFLISMFLHRRPRRAPSNPPVIE